MQFQQHWPKDKKYSSLNFSQENLENFRAKICNFSKIGAKIENNSFHKGKIQGEIAKKLQEGQVIWPNVFQTKGRSGLLEERLAYLQKGRHESLSEKAGFMF